MSAPPAPPSAVVVTRSWSPYRRRFVPLSEVQQHNSTVPALSIAPTQTRWVADVLAKPSDEPLLIVIDKADVTERVVQAPLVAVEERKVSFQAPVPVDGSVEPSACFSAIVMADEATVTDRPTFCRASGSKTWPVRGSSKTKPAPLPTAFTVTSPVLLTVVVV